MERTLRQLRQDSQKSIGQILAEVRHICPEIAPKERSGIINWEVQGFVDFRIIRALSTVYDAKESEIANAALSAKESFRKTREEKSSNLATIA